MNFYVVTLGFAALLISTLGAAFSVYGLASLFSGSFYSVALMAAGLEFSKIIAVAFLHRHWQQLSFALRTYLLLASIVLVVITSMGIFGFLSNSYQQSSADLNKKFLEISQREADIKRSQDEMARLQAVLDEIPASRITKKLALQKEYDPLMKDLNIKINTETQALSTLKLDQLKINSKVGPLIYVSKAFNTEIDTVVKWLIFLFVCVFDPLAVSLVMAVSTAIQIYSNTNQKRRRSDLTSPPPPNKNVA